MKTKLLIRTLFWGAALIIVVAGVDMAMAYLEARAQKKILKTASEVSVTVPEGLTKIEIADILEKKGVTSKSAFLGVRAPEGTLFPDTYKFSLNSSADAAVQKMEDNFQRRMDGQDVPKDRLILASIIERETPNIGERPIIAGIYLNRLSKSMKLEADPTVQYAKYTDLGQAPVVDGQKDYWAKIKASDYQSIKSSYNTYISEGLPPGPICNPGLSAIHAALNPDKTDYLYFFHAGGNTYFSKTVEEHDANKAKYLK